jgi:hypothetical protein
MRPECEDDELTEAGVTSTLGAGAMKITIVSKEPVGY